jgi:N-acetylneuraminate synthase
VIGDREPPYVIAEIGSNHNGDMDLCRRLIDAAKSSGADAVKFQSWSPQSLISTGEFERNTSYEDKKRHFGSLKEMVERYHLTEDQHRVVADYCKVKGITFLSTPFSFPEVDMLDALGVPCFKIASMDINHLPLLRHIGRKEKPVLLSTGMATIREVHRAVEELFSVGCRAVALLHCVSLYPPDPQLLNLNNIPMLRRTFQLPVGFSDHTVGVSIAMAAIALGAHIIEKHFTLDRDMEGWDHWVSATPAELATIVAEGRNVSQALGVYERIVTQREIDKRRSFRRRIVVRRALPAGAVVTWDDLDYKRPGTGIHPDESEYVVGRRLGRSVEADHELEWADLV